MTGGGDDNRAHLDEEVVVPMTGGAAALGPSLERVRYEVVPMKGVEAQIEHLPLDAVVTVTVSPTKGLRATLDLTRMLTERGHATVPHLAARLLTDAAELGAVIDELRDVGVREVFVVAGDAKKPAGAFEGAAELLEAMASLGHHLEGIGITGYPETHAFIPDQTTIDAMARKAPHATYIVSQICYDPATIRGWIEAVRARGVHLPIFVGLPGVVDRKRLLKLSMRVGLGDSVRFLSKQSSVASRLLTGYEPDELIHALRDLIGHPALQVEGWHLFTFNEIERTERWRRQMLAEVRRAAP